MMSSFGPGFYLCLLLFGGDDGAVGSSSSVVMVVVMVSVTPLAVLMRLCALSCTAMQVVELL